MQIINVKIVYMSNYNGCTVMLNDEHDMYNLDTDHPDLAKKLDELQDEVCLKAADDVIMEGRYEGTFNGDIDDLAKFAVAKALEMFGDVEVAFEEDDCSN